MSTEEQDAIQTTQIDGDVSVGRNVALGGGFISQGKGRVKGDLVVDGWLDAKNIKGVFKGIYLTVEKLKADFPEPEDGWWAIVGKTIPGPIYAADNGKWVATGEIGGQPTISGDEYYESLFEVLQYLTEEFDAFTATKGMPNGLAPLDSESKIPATYLPSYVDDVIEFAKTVESVTVQPSSIDKSSTDSGCSVIYDKAKNVFVLSVTDSTGTKYYKDWNDSDAFGDESDIGIVPQSGKVYVDNNENKTYRWSGTKLVVIGSDLSLGYTEATAFPGSDGKELQQTVALQEQAITSLTSTINSWDNKILNKLDKSVWDSIFILHREDEEDPTKITSIEVKANLWTNGNISAGGQREGGSGGSTGGLIQTVYRYTQLNITLSDNDKTNTFNAYTIQQLANRIESLESTPSGISSLTINLGTVSYKGVGTTDVVVNLPAYPTTLPASDVYAWAKQPTKPTYTAAEVGALTQATADGRYLKLAGGKMSGNITMTGYSILWGTNVTLNWDSLASKGLHLMRSASGTGGTPTTYAVGVNLGAGSYNFQLASAGSGDNKLYYRGYNTNTSAWDSWVSLWHSGNDGSGSGLDADLLDGTHKSGLLTSVTSSSATNLSIVVGGTTKSVADIYATYASQLQTARTIFGQSFNGTENVQGQAEVFGTYSAGSSKYITGGIQVREADLVLSTQSAAEYAPSIGFHWGGRTAANILMNSEGTFELRAISFATYAPLYCGYLNSSDLQIYNSISTTGRTVRLSLNWSGEVARIYAITNDGNVEKDLLLGASSTSSFGALFYDASTERWGIGTNTPAMQLHVAGDARFDGWIYSYDQHGWYNSTYGGGIYMTDSTYVRVYNGKAFYVANNIVATGQVSAGNASDRRLKSDISTLSERETAHVLSHLNPVSFTWNAKAEELSGGDKKGIARSFVADEFLSLLPNAGRKMWDTYDAIYTEQAVPYLVKGWQMHERRLSDHERRIQELEKENKELKRQLRRVA